MELNVNTTKTKTSKVPRIKKVKENGDKVTFIVPQFEFEQEELLVGINGKGFRLKCGYEVTVPVEYYELIQASIAERKKSNSGIRESLIKKTGDLGMKIY